MRNLEIIDNTFDNHFTNDESLTQAQLLRARRVFDSCLWRWPGVEQALPEWLMEQAIDAARVEAGMIVAN